MDTTSFAIHSRQSLKLCMVISNIATLFAQCGHRELEPATLGASISYSEYCNKLQSAKINQSLLALGRVIQHLADKPCQSRVSKQHIPYRDSNLTRLLQPVLGGNSKTAIIATIAPGRSSLENTKATLHFIGVAAKVRRTVSMDLLQESCY
jgi:hypothetical protein